MKDPIALFQAWLQEAVDAGIAEPSAMTVATVDVDGHPDARMLLLKGCDERGFVFFTNMESPKARALLREPRAALCFYWAKIDKQVRIRGHASVVSDEEADAYFATRPRLSQISAWASKQSQPMQGYFELEAEVAKATLRFGIGDVPRPPFWSASASCRRGLSFGRKDPSAVTIAFCILTIDGWQTEWLYP